MKRGATKKRKQLAIKGIHRIMGIGTMVGLAVILLICPMAYATEGGGSAYPGGNEDFMAGALPPPGMYPMLYNVYFAADKLVGDNGDEIPVDFELDLYASVLRFVHVTEHKLLGADVAWHVIIPFMKVDAAVSTPVGRLEDSASGISDIEFSPLVLGWHFSKNLHLASTIDFWAPVGAYDKDDLVNIGRNYWTMAPIIATTYISDSGFEVSAKFQYLINFENTDTDYTSGNELIIDYLVGQHVGSWNFGINGCIYKQITEDDRDGNTVEGNKAQYFSIGPAIQFNYKNMFFNAKWQVDTSVQNRPEGQKFWLKLMYAF